MTMNLRYLSPADLKTMSGLQNGNLPQKPTEVKELLTTTTHVAFDDFTPTSGGPSTAVPKAYTHSSFEVSSYKLKNKDSSFTTFEVVGVDGKTVPYLNGSNTQLGFPMMFTDMGKVITLANPIFDKMMRDEGFYGVQKIQIYIVDIDKDGDEDMLVTHSGLLGAYLISNDATPSRALSNQATQLEDDQP